MRKFFVTLNWNTTAYFKRLVDTVEAVTSTEHTWVIVENGSRESEYQALLEYCAARWPTLAVVGAPTPAVNAPCVIVRSKDNLGCVLGHNLAFDVCAAITNTGHYDIVMFDTDVEVYETDWLLRVEHWLADKPQIGIVGMEHSSHEVCAGAVSLDTAGYWYLHPRQTNNPVPMRAESVGLGMALLRWPVTQLRFDTGFEIYYKQDDDLCFQARALGMDVWAYPLQMVHWGSRGLQENAYCVNENVGGYNAFDQVKRKNQAYFAKKWAWALRGRRESLAAEQQHLQTMAELMRERRADTGIRTE